MLGSTLKKNNYSVSDCRRDCRGDPMARFDVCGVSKMKGFHERISCVGLLKKYTFDGTAELLQAAMQPCSHTVL